MIVSAGLAPRASRTSSYIVMLPSVRTCSKLGICAPLPFCTAKSCWVAAARLAAFSRLRSPWRSSGSIMDKLWTRNLEEAGAGNYQSRRFVVRDSSVSPGARKHGINERQRMGSNLYRSPRTGGRGGGPRSTVEAVAISVHCTSKTRAIIADVT